ncbi:MAG TPA: hypothetical protein VK212_02440 [Lentimicrobium sp.]|nr:hypothetical protein [Lentimicrobium sp.]
MEITINNYEVFIIDYLDGRLGPLETAQLLVFLENHPGLKEEFEDLKTITVTPSQNETFGFNESLKQPADIDAVNLSMLNYPHYFIAAVEGDLSSTGFNLLNNFLTEHPELHSDYELFKATKLIPDKKIRYSEPSALKKGTGVFTEKHVFFKYYYATAIAAGLLLLFTIWLRLTPGTDSDLDNNLRQSIEKQGEYQDINKIPDSNTDNLTNESGYKETVTPNNESAIRNQKSGIRNQNSGIRNPESETANQKSEVRNPKSGIRNTESGIQKIEKRGMVINTTPLYSENRTRNFYSGLYDDIKLSQEMTMAEKEESDQTRNAVKSPVEKKGTIAAGRMLSSVLESGGQLAQQIPESLNGWLFADLGVKGFNLLTNNSYVIDRKLNNKGKIQFLKLIEEEKENL